MTPSKIAVIGGECTGKTTLCEALAATLPGIWVPEYLREFVEHEERVPVAQDQAPILAMQIEREHAAEAAAARAGVRWIACDSAPIVVAIYSEMYFGDRTLYARATAHQAGYALTLLMDTDIAWEPNGLQRESPAVRAETHRRLLAWLAASRIAYTLISGGDAARLSSAIAAVRALESPAR